LRGFVPIIVAAALGLGAGMFIGAGWRRDWNAAAAIATFAAVLVALVPIWREEGRRQQSTRALRLRLIAPLAAVYFAFEKVAQQAPLPLAVPLDDNMMRLIARIDALVPQADLLEIDEMDMLAQVVTALNGAAVVRGVTRDRFVETTELLDRTCKLLGPRIGARRSSPVTSAVAG